MKLSKEKYLKLKAVADKLGGVGSHEVYNKAGEPCCLWGLAIYAKITDMSPYEHTYGEEDVLWGTPAWLLQASKPFSEAEAILPGFLKADRAVIQVLTEETKTLGRVPLDDLLAKLNVEIEDDSKRLEVVGTSAT